MKFINIKKLLAIGGAILLAGALNSHAQAQQKNDPKYNKMMQDSFRAEGIAGLDRIEQDATQKFCSDTV
ncbi:MAG: sulfur oxidation c-type cytochrome SoxX, partial [Betaproteobacteria bacterium]|nr:sulfur oxidation c-type cytochrome SoxX [Betaproteobacteria bacterium]